MASVLIVHAILCASGCVCCLESYSQIEQQKGGGGRGSCVCACVAYTGVTDREGEKERDWTQCWAK
jgi:hypothetical protein